MFPVINTKYTGSFLSSEEGRKTILTLLLESIIIWDSTSCINTCVRLYKSYIDEEELASKIPDKSTLSKIRTSRQEESNSHMSD